MAALNRPRGARRSPSDLDAAVLALSRGDPLSQERERRISPLAYPMCVKVRPAHAESLCLSLRTGGKLRLLLFLLLLSSLPRLFPGRASDLSFFISGSSGDSMEFWDCCFGERGSR